MAVLGCLAATSRVAEGQFAVTRMFTVSEAVPDGGELLATGDFSVGSATIANLGVHLTIDGSPSGAGFNGDLYATLAHVSGFSVLINRAGRETLTGLGYSDSGFDVVLRDGAEDIHRYRRTLGGSDLVPVGDVVRGTWSPDGRDVDPAAVLGNDARTSGLSSFFGTDAEGEWQLFVADLVVGGTHAVARWGLEVETAGGFAGPVHFANDSIRALGEARTLPNPTRFEGTVGFTSSHGLTFSGDLTLQGSVEFRVENTTRFAGPLGASGVGMVLTKSGPGTLALAGAGTYTGGTTVQEGVLRLENTAGSATGSGPIVVLANAVLGGNGIASGTVEVRSGGVLRPDRGGTALRTGAQTWLGGGIFQMEMASADTVAGTGWGRVAVDGPLQIGATAGNPFRIEIVSLDLAGQPGAVHDFDARRSYFWPLATASGGVAGFGAEKFSVDPGASLGAADGVFEVALIGDSLGVRFEAVPEVTGTGVAGAALGLLALGRRVRARGRTAAGR